MTANWTDLDPGAGDPARCATAKAWIDRQLIDLANAQTTVSTILRDLDGAWTGQSATAFRARLEEFRTRLEDSIEAMTSARKAIITYGDALADIARRAEPLRQDLAAAQAALSGVLNDSSYGGGSEMPFDAEQQALSDASAAASALKKLGFDRQGADQSLAVALATAASTGWGGLDCSIDPVTGVRRDAANEQVMDLFEHFRSGDERGAVLTDDDIFVQTLMHSAHIAAVRELVLEDLRSNKLTPQAPRFYDRAISDNPWVLGADAINVLSSTMTGTVPDALLGWVPTTSKSGRENLARMAGSR